MQKNTTSTTSSSNGPNVSNDDLPDKVKDLEINTKNVNQKEGDAYPQLMILLFYQSPLKNP